MRPHGRLCPAESKGIPFKKQILGLGHMSPWWPEGPMPTKGPTCKICVLLGLGPMVSKGQTLKTCFGDWASGGRWPFGPNVPKGTNTQTKMLQVHGTLAPKGPTDPKRATLNQKFCWSVPNETLELKGPTNPMGLTLKQTLCLGSGPMKPLGPKASRAQRDQH